MTKVILRKFYKSILVIIKSIDSSYGMVSSIMVEDKLMHVFLAFSFLLLLANAIPVKAANDSLKPGDTLNSSNELCSAGGTFCMGFEEFPAGSGLTYLRIYKINANWISWLANRDEPVMNESGVLTLDSSGALKILRQNQDPITLYSSPQPTNINTMATLFDNGNFELRELQSNGSVLWQSFDYPTDVLLPGMKLGVNHKTGHSWFLLSSARDNSPAPGAFTLEWDTISRELKISRRGQVYWRSGTLINKKFQYISDHMQDMYRYTTVSNEDEDSFTYTTQNNNYTLWSLDDSGELVDGKGNVIASADKCYGYNTDEGCQRWQVPSCRNDGQVFDVLTGYLNGSSDVTIDANASLTLSDCKAACWSNCDCIAFYSYFDNKTGCTFHNGDSWEFINYASGQSIHMIVTKALESKSTKKWIWISSVIAMVLLISFVGIICLVRKRREEKQKTVEIGKNLRVFSYASIMTATNRFSSANKLGEGGFGSVYKGKLQMAKEVAIKRLSRSSRQGITEFKNELRLISELQHTNLVQLLGYCTHGHERILIYEYMPNKSLDFFLFDSTKKKLLDWKKRFNIIEGIVQGLLYLHRYSRLKVIHRDLKAGNVLLDENMNPKISDFGLARIFTQESGENTTRLAGTLGYMPPECVMEQVYSIKSDVYSFGVLMLEIVSGRRNNHFGVLLKHAWELWTNGEGLKLMDPAITDSADQDQILRCIHVALLCLEGHPVNRPNMSEILSMLTNESSTLRLPKNPAFNFRSGGVEEIQSTVEPNINTINGLTISVVSAR